MLATLHFHGWKIEKKQENLTKVQIEFLSTYISVAKERRKNDEMRNSFNAFIESAKIYGQVIKKGNKNVDS